MVSIIDDQTSPTIWSSKSMMENDDKSKLSTGNESADILFCCETFEVIALDVEHLNSCGAALLFRSFTGHHIEFRTNAIKPLESMTLKCEGLYVFYKFFNILLRHCEMCFIHTVKIKTIIICYSQESIKKILARIKLFNF